MGAVNVAGHKECQLSDLNGHRKHRNAELRKHACVFLQVEEPYKNPKNGLGSCPYKCNFQDSSETMKMELDHWYCLYLKSAHGEQMLLSRLFPGCVASSALTHHQHEVLMTSSKCYNILMGEGH